MQAPTIIRKMDSLGRIVIPVELRRMVGIETGQELELQVRNEELILRKFSPGCVFCGALGEQVFYRGRNICRLCLGRLRAVSE